MVTCDGSFTEIGRQQYEPAEERTVRELKKLNKPFIVLLNTTKPYSEETGKLAEVLSEKYQVSVLPVNCEQLKKEDIRQILEKLLCEFPLTVMEFYMPKWV